MAVPLLTLGEIAPECGNGELDARHLMSVHQDAARNSTSNCLVTSTSFHGKR